MYSMFIKMVGTLLILAGQFKWYQPFKMDQLINLKS